jgi:hypothetical protein
MTLEWRFLFLLALLAFAAAGVLAAVARPLHHWPL